MSSTAAGTAFLLRPTSATTHPLLHLSIAGANPKSHFLRLHPSRRRLPVPRLSVTPPDTTSNNSAPAPSPPSPSPTPPPPLLSKWSPPRAIWRGLSALLLAGQVFHRVLTGRVHRRNLLAQLRRVGPGSAGVSLLTAAFVGMAFTIQFVREFTRLGLHRSVGVLALALSHELSPVVTALGLASSAFLTDAIFGVSTSIILESARRALRPWDLISSLLKSQVFGAIIAVVSCAWGVTTHGGAKGVGESTTSAVVVSLVGIFIADFALSCLFFQGAGDSLKYAMG